jgi:hypothetical protein
MNRRALIVLGFLGVLAGATACSAADPGEREPLVPVEFRQNGFSVGRVSYAGECLTTFYEDCRAESDGCLGRCSGLSNDLYLSCAQVCWSYDCSGTSDRCADYSAEFDFGPADSTLASACGAWETALRTSCNATRPEGYCQRVSTTWKTEFASVFECSAAQTRAGVCAESCELPGSSFGDELCNDLGADPTEYALCSVANLLGAVLRDDVKEAAYACLTYDEQSVHQCLNAWQESVVP